MRAKGILRSADEAGKRLVFQMVGKRYELTTEEEEAPALSSVVAIGRRGSFDPERLTGLFDGCVSR
jgi:G3E family GTPase